MPPSYEIGVEIGCTFSQTTRKQKERPQRKSPTRKPQHYQSIALGYSDINKIIQVIRCNVSHTSLNRDDPEIVSLKSH